MVAITSLLIVLSLSFLITRIATVALTLTGLSYELAHLQSISAFTGVGFTTHESEHLVRHPVRRRILMILMILGNAGIITAISSLILSFAGVEQQQGLERLLWLGVGLLLLWAVTISQWVNRHLSRLIYTALRRLPQLEVRDYASLLQLSEDYTVMEWEVDPEDWVTEKPIAELNLPEEGVIVLGIHREDGGYVGAPRGQTSIRQGDRLILYGRRDNLAELSDRKIGLAGEEAHRRAVADQAETMRRQDADEQRRDQAQAATETT